MITIKHPIEFPNTYPLDRIGPLKDLLFFDIETTGFSGETSQLYLIGCTYFDGFGWKLIQWFADTRQAEKELLDPFSVVVLGNFRRFLLVIFLFLFLHLDFSFIYSKFSMPFWGFFY